MKVDGMRYLNACDKKKDREAIKIYDGEIVVYEHEFNNNEVKAAYSNAEIDSDDNVDSIHMSSSCGNTDINVKFTAVGIL